MAVEVDINDPQGLAIPAQLLIAGILPQLVGQRKSTDKLDFSLTETMWKEAMNAATIRRIKFYSPTWSWEPLGAKLAR